MTGGKGGEGKNKINPMINPTRYPDFPNAIELTDLHELNARVPR